MAKFESSVLAQATPSRLPVIDAFRGFAALLVCAFHARQIIWVGMQAYWKHHNPQDYIGMGLAVVSAPLRYGGVAVPLFFVISGYCIHRSFASSLSNAGPTMSSWLYYFVRRAWRIYPVFICALLLTLLLDSFSQKEMLADGERLSFSFRTAVGDLAGLQGLIVPHYGSNFPLWSLSVELQLYAVYPCIFYIARAGGVKLCVLLILGFSLIMACLDATVWSSVTWFGPYWFCWTIGVVVAEMEGGRIEISMPKGWIFAWILISAFGFVLWIGRWNNLAFSCVGLFWAVIVLSCLRSAAGLKYCHWPVRLMGVVGVFSYSLYATHVPVCFFIKYCILDGKQLGNILAVIPVILGCIGIAFLVWLCIERFSLRVPNWLRKAVRYKPETVKLHRL